MFATTVTTSLLFTLAALPGPQAMGALHAVAPAQSSGAAEQKDMRVHFGLNDAELTAEDRDRLAIAAKCLRANENVKIELVGHADERGTSEFNLALGERRALSVKKYLEGLGVKGGQMRTLSLGEEKPVAESSDEASWAENRRVELHTPSGFNITASVCGAATVAEAQPKEAEQKPQEEAKPKEEEKPKETAQTDDAGKGKKAGFWKPPLWLGPLVMAISIPATLLAIPPLISMLYVGWTRFTPFGSCSDLLTGEIASPQANFDPSTNCGSLWSTVLHQQYANAPLAIVAGVIVAVFALVAIVSLVAGAGLLIWALIPGGEEAEPAPAAAPAENETAAPAPAGETTSM